MSAAPCRARRSRSSSSLMALKTQTKTKKHTKKQSKANEASDGWCRWIWKVSVCKKGKSNAAGRIRTCEGRAHKAFKANSLTARTRPQQRLFVLTLKQFCFDSDDDCFPCACTLLAVRAAQSTGMVETRAHIHKWQRHGKRWID